MRLAALMAMSDTHRVSRPLATRVRPGAFQVALSGDIDLMSSGRLTLIAQDFLQSDHASAEVDLHGVTFIDSTGLLLLVRLHRTALVRGGKVTLLQPSGVCLLALESVAFDKVFDIQLQGTSASGT